MQMQVIIMHAELAEADMHAVNQKHETESTPRWPGASPSSGPGLARPGGPGLGPSMAWARPWPSLQAKLGLA